MKARLATLLLCTMLPTISQAYETVSEGEAFAASKPEACNKAMDRAREAAAQEARVYVSSKYERRINVLSGQVADNVTHQTYQSTFGITDLEEIISSRSEYDEASGSITCRIKARFKVDAEAVDKELQARLSLEEAKIKEGERKALLLESLRSNETKYAALKNRGAGQHTVFYTGSAICKESNSVTSCKAEIAQKFERIRESELAQELDISATYIDVSYTDFEGDEAHKPLSGYDNTYVVTMTGNYRYYVTISDPYALENRRIINELAMINGEPVHSKSKERRQSLDDEDSVEGDFYIRPDIAFIKGNFINNDENIDVGVTEAFVTQVLQIGLVFDINPSGERNLFRVSYLKGSINFLTCLSPGGDTKCGRVSSDEFDMTGLGIDKIFAGSGINVIFGAAYYKLDEREVIDTNFFQIRAGIASSSLIYIYGDINAMLPTKDVSYMDIEPSFDISVGLGIRF